MESRIAELELKLNLAETHIEEIELTLYRQQQQLDLLQGQLRELHRQLQAGTAQDAGEARNLRDEIPPHY